MAPLVWRTSVPQPGWKSAVMPQMLVKDQCPASTTLAFQTGVVADLKFSSMTKFPATPMLLSSEARMKKSGTLSEATVTPGSTGFSMGTASARPASGRVSCVRTRPAVTPPKL